MEDLRGLGIVLGMQSPSLQVSNLMRGSLVKQTPCKPLWARAVKKRRAACLGMQWGRFWGDLWVVLEGAFQGSLVFPSRPSIWWLILCLVDILWTRSPGTPQYRLGPASSGHTPAGWTLSPKSIHNPQPNTSELWSQQIWVWIQMTTDSRFPHLWTGKNS